MNQFNRQLSAILEKHDKNPPGIIQELFNLLPYQGPEEKKMTQTAILYTMETIHEWQNILYYIEKWQLYQFRQDLIERMRRRLNEQPPQQEQNSHQELQRLVTKYWQKQSPQKQEHKYKEPIDIRRRTKKTDINQPALAQQQPQVLETNSGPEGSNRGNVVQTQSFSNLTGRPAILKKSSMFDANKVQKEDTNMQEYRTKAVEVLSVDNLREKPMEIERSRKQEEVPLKAASAESLDRPEQHKNVYRILSEFCQTAARDRNSQHRPQLNTEQVKDMVSAQQVDKKVQKQNQPYPSVEHFCFGSTKKTKEAEMKKLTISPIKRLSVTNKIVRIKRTEPEPDPNFKDQAIHQAGDFHNDFSFKREEISSLKPQNQNSLRKVPEPAAILNDQIQRTPIIQSLPARKQSSSKAEKKVNEWKAEKSRRQFLSLEELSVVEDVGPKYFVSQFLKQRGISWLGTLRDKLSKISDF